MKTCILITTYDRYRPVAEFTRQMIDEYWKDHPPVYFCGCSGQSGEGYLSLRDHPEDWIGILASAVDDLIKEGYERAYYVMDDCPPIYTCSERHLGHTIPDLMNKLGASYISLVGWDQRRSKDDGEVLGRDCYRIQRQSSKFLWRYSTDPCYWNLYALRDICGVLEPTEDPMSRSAWAFERRLGESEELLPEKWQEKSYRICGLDMLDGASGWCRKIARLTGYYAYDVVRLLARLLGGSRALDRLDSIASVETHFYDGPYPTYWAGVMTKGMLNENVMKFLKRHKKQRYLSELTAVIEKVSSG